MRIAILDLGTNTFNLLIAELSGNNNRKIIVNQKIHVKIGKGGIHNNKITGEAFRRGIQAIREHVKTIGLHHVYKSYAFATAAIRNAENGKEFIHMLESDYNIEVNIISGDREAELIYNGVRQAVELTGEKILILDIGGGSNEFIIADKNRIYWKKSYRLGIALLVEKFKPSDPVTEDEISKITAYIRKETGDLSEKIKEYDIKTLIGASGSFETFVAMIKRIKNFESEISRLPESVRIDLQDFHFLYDQLIVSTESERKKMKGLEPERIDMIVLGSLFVKVIIEKGGIKNLYMSSYALKEGALYELIEGLA